mmetsp:Transcript_34318/g.61890  ORF Transcript_34318/g.61890 Transcript_34318/m.61890 type:complete len:375 (-) Transcript_34318:827-1951(-)
MYQESEDPEQSDEHEEDEKLVGQGGYRFDSAEHLAALKLQRQQLWSWIKNVGRNVLKEGINLTKISLPVCLFEPRSFLERLTQNFEYVDFLLSAINCDPIDRMKYIVCFAVSGLSRQISFHKPFNPILGETYQAVYDNGVKIFCEQISHHPPVSSWQLMDLANKVHFYGNGNWVAGIKGNSVKGRQSGKNCVEFSDGTCISYDLPGLTVKGVLFGLRVLKYSGTMRFVDEKNDLECIVEIDPQPPSGSFLSSWFRKKDKDYKPDQIVGKLTKNGEVVDVCSGNWLSHLDWNRGLASVNQNKKSTRLWDIKKTPISVAKGLGGSEVLPSDCRLREDVVFLKQDDQEKAQEWKLILEERQRRDRKLRKEGGVDCEV